MMKPIYEGSVKTVFQDVKNPAINYFHFTDDYSIFDWGKMPDTIAHKGKALSILGGLLFRQLALPETWRSLPQAEELHALSPDFRAQVFASPTFQKLCQDGLGHHFLGWSTPDGQSLSSDDLAEYPSAPLMKVRSVHVSRPTAFHVDRQTLYTYDFTVVPSSIPALIPLEVVFRFGMPQGSSLEKRLKADSGYYRTLGLLEPPQPETLFSRPVIEFFTKLEPTDRFLTSQEAYFISALTESQFAGLYDTALLVSLWLYRFFAQRGIELWDGKFEFAWTPEGIILVDSIGPDELRLLRHQVHLSKELIRQFYRSTPWEHAVREAKLLADTRPGEDWKDICQQELGQAPSALPSSQKHLVDNLYGALVNHLFDAPYIGSAVALDALIDAMKTHPPQPIGAATV